MSPISAWASKVSATAPLDKVNVKTVKNLVPVWSFSFGGEKQRGQESQPLIHDGKMFVTASYSRIYALDAKTGKKLWKYEHRLPEGIMPCCDVINRGAALYDGDLVIFATLDAQLVALNGNRQGRLERQDRRLRCRLLRFCRSADRQGHGHHRRVRWRVRCRAAWKPATPRPARWCGCVRPLKATWVTSG